DLGPDLGSYGEKQIHTPHLDQLAKEGVRYSHCFTSAAVCSPSRSGLITGMYPVSIDCHQHRTRFKKDLPSPVKPVTELFREAGYWVSNGNAQDMEKFGKTDYNFIHKKSALFDGTDWRGRQEGQPFFAQVQIFYPHRPFLPDTIHPVNPDEVELPPFYPNHILTKEDWALYLETVQHVDKVVDRILKRLEEDDLTENTFIFFVGDQGRPHVRSKQFLYDQGTHTPLVVRWPDGRLAGTNNDRLVSNIDLAASSLLLAGIQPPKWMQGRDFLQEESEPRNYVFTMRDRCDESTDRIRAVRTQRFKYIRNYYPHIPWAQFNAYKATRYPSNLMLDT
ncbi:MAG: sulfatase, partial [Bacteroidota bacterium]